MNNEFGVNVGWADITISIKKTLYTDVIWWDVKAADACMVRMGGLSHLTGGPLYPFGPVIPISPWKTANLWFTLTTLVWSFIVNVFYHRATINVCSMSHSQGCLVFLVDPPHLSFPLWEPNIAWHDAWCLSQQTRSFVQQTHVMTQIQSNYLQAIASWKSHRAIYALNPLQEPINALSSLLS